MYKKLKNKKAKFILGFILLIALNFMLFYSFLIPVNHRINEFKEIKSSGVYYDIAIDDLPSSSNNWAWAKTQPWFGGGSGTSGDPYIIENHIFEYSAGSGFCFSIINSKKYFIINNCTFRNSNSGNVGLLLTNVTNGQIFNSSIYNSLGDGIWIEDTNGILISNNEIYDNTYSGIYITGTSENNIITGNIFDNNGWYGVEIDSSYNLFYSNYFINPNTDHAYDGSFFNNDWNNSVIGNYWDDYGGYDMDLDGIGDTPYDVPPGGGTQDYLPMWNIQAPISIDDLPSSPDNWAWAETQPWFGGGAGTSGDPYILENFNIDGDNAGSCILVNNSNKHFIVRDCRLYNSGGMFFTGAIILLNVTNSQILDNNASSNEGVGIFLINCDYNTISGNIANLNDFGLLLLGSNHSFISENIFNNNSVGGAIIADSHHNNIIGNTMNNNWNGTYVLNSDNNIISGNTWENNAWGITLSSSNLNIISENTATQNFMIHIFLINSNNNTLYKNVDKLSTYGISLRNSHFNEILECEVYNIFNKGIYLTGSNENIISQNIVMYNFWGLFAQFSDGNTFSNNIFNNNTELGIEVDFSAYNKILGNTVNFNKMTRGGIIVSASNHTIVQDNTVIGNNHYGIGIIYSSDSNNVSGNVIKENTLGVFIHNNSNNNLVYENFFLQNGLHALDNGLNNDWNSTTIGNYWDNWTGPDKDPIDGIVDVPYNISGSAGSKDYLPIADDTLPIVIINLPTDENLFGIDAPNYDVTITDTYLFEMWYTLDGGLHNYTFTEFTGIIDQSAWEGMPDGMITLTFYASDKAGNKGSADVIVEKDTQAPTIIINSPTSGATFGANAPSFIVEISDDNLDSMWYSIDDGLTNFTFTANGTINQAAWAALSEGSVAITFYANDTLGNIAFESVNIEKDLPTQGDDFIIIIIVISIVSGAAIVTIILVVVLRKRKVGELVPGEEIPGEEI